MAATEYYVKRRAYFVRGVCDGIDRGTNIQVNPDRLCSEQYVARLKPREQVFAIPTGKKNVFGEDLLKIVEPTPNKMWISVDIPSKFLSVKDASFPRSRHESPDADYIQKPRSVLEKEATKNSELGTSIQGGVLIRSGVKMGLFSALALMLGAMFLSNKK